MKLLIYGIDGGNWPLINMGIQKGTLPTIKTLIGEGISGILRSTIPPWTCPAVCSFITGLNPGQHGLYTFVDFDDRLILNVGKQDKFWDRLADKGIKSCIGGLPFCYPAHLKNGVMISGAPVPKRNDKMFYPREIATNLWPDYIGEPDLSTLARSKNDVLLNAELKNAQDGFAVFRNLIRKDNYDLSLFWDIWLDSVQHFLWHRPELMLKYYQQIDGRLEYLLNQGKYDAVLLLSDHGSEANNWHFYTNRWLKEEGYLHQSRLGEWVSIFEAAISQSPQLSIILKSLADKILGKKKTDRLVRKDLGVGDNSQAISKIFFGIDTNEKMRDEIIGKLKALQFNGHPIFRLVLKREDEYHGQYADMFPSIVFLGNEGITPQRRQSRKLIRQSTELRTGQHDSAIEGIYIAWGKGIKDIGLHSGMRIWELTHSIMKLFE